MVIYYYFTIACISGPPGPVKILNASSYCTTTEITVTCTCTCTWERPTNTTTILCVEVYSESENLVNGNCSIPVNDTSYSFTVDNPGVYRIIITPRFDVPGARNGTTSDITVVLEGMFT